MCGHCENARTSLKATKNTGENSFSKPRKYGDQELDQSPRKPHEQAPSREVLLPDDDASKVGAEAAMLSSVSYSKVARMNKEISLHEHCVPKHVTDRQREGEETKGDHNISS